MTLKSEYNKKLDKKDFTPPTIDSITNMPTADGGETNYYFEQKPNTAISMFKQNPPKMKQVNNFGKSFPMIKPDPTLNPIGAAEVNNNRAAGAVDRNVLQANPNTPQPMDKVPASQFRNEMFNSRIASSAGQPLEQATNTPPNPVFSNQQGMAAYGAPEQIEGNQSADIIAKGGKDIQQSIQEAGDEMAKKGEEKEAMAKRLIAGVATGGASEATGAGKALAGTSMYDDKGLGFNAGLKNAMKDKEGSFADMVADAPGMYGKHTKITKGNVNAAKKDDKAHIDYLKRDINYDAKHGGSNKNMTADEKHISKLAGDIKYDTFKKKKYDNV
tara:strand:+ start:1462 stop:2448 length:987 start_codon:yes stop_codon:yes gene_type:complete